MSQDKELIEGVLAQEPGDLEFDPIPDEGASPLNQPVLEGDISMGAIPAYEPPEQEIAATESEPEGDVPEANTEPTAQEWEAVPPPPEQPAPTRKEEPQHRAAATSQFEANTSEASEQTLNQPEETEGEGGAATATTQTAKAELPDEHAELATETILGVTDNLLEIGGGFFVKVKKRGEYFDFEEIIQEIDEANTRNIEAMRLDEVDKILLRPLLTAVLKQRAAELTPEQMLITAIVSILMKKAKVMADIRAENKAMEKRILASIEKKKEKEAEEKRNGRNQPVDTAFEETVVPAGHNTPSP